MGNHGKNSSNYPHFFRIILPHHLEKRSILELPRKFVKKHGECLHKYARLELPTGSHHQMELKMDKKRAWLHRGWPDFVDRCSIQSGFFLVFKYKGKSRFGVRIYDLTTSEINYPPRSSDKLINDKEEAKAIICNRSSFTVVMRQSYVDYLYMLHIPDAHSQRYLRSHNEKQAFLFVDGVEDGQIWPVKIYYKSERSGTRFSSGWKDFVMDNNLKRGDSCEFELLSHKPNYYKVTISRVAHESP